MVKALICCLVLAVASASPLFFEQLVRKNVKENASAKHWGLIVAGSNGYYNYRHQADACHAYQVLHAHGIPDERIVVMMYDDIANNQQNPTPGIIINHPNGKDVYKGVPKDYTGRDVTPGNFLSILQGDKDAMRGIGSGKVIQSGPNDHVFVYFTDHGAPHIVAFPTSELHDTDLLHTLNSMHDNNKYKQLVFYLEACESGSMFEALRKDINVFATTAANARESSYACYYDKVRQTYLGDVYSVKWLEDSDAKDLNTETLQTQFLIVKKETNTSHCQEFGDMSISKSPVAQFQGEAQATGLGKMGKLPQVPFDAVPQEDVPLAILSHRLHDARTPQEKNKVLYLLAKEWGLRYRINSTVERILGKLERPQAHVDHFKLTNHQCYKQAVRAFSKNCFILGQDDYALRHMYKFVNLCEYGLDTSTIVHTIVDTCLSQ